ncbi:MAG TPA: heavy metal-associated domain-containing protein [Anaerolineales bacterium]|nr:heavy metal-associated domain-containing protein [Anaerolineales bacterium]
MDPACHVEPVLKRPSDEELEHSADARLAIQGMGCPNCAARVRNSLLSLQGVVDAAVDHESGLAEVVFNPALVDRQGLLKAVTRAGHDGRHEYHAHLIA